MLKDVYTPDFAMVKYSVISLITECSDQSSYFETADPICKLKSVYFSYSPFDGTSLTCIQIMKFLTRTVEKNEICLEYMRELFSLYS